MILQVEEIIEHFHSTEMCIYDLLKHDICSKFVDIKSQLSKFKSLFNRFKMSFMKKLSQLLPKIRSYGAEEMELADLISLVNESPFEFGELEIYLRGKEKEIKQLSQYLKNMEKESKIQFDFPNTRCNLTKLIIDDKFEYVACFEFNVTSETSVYLRNLERYLQTGENKPPGNKEWFNKPETAKELKAKSKKFLTFVKENSDNEKVAFAVVCSIKETKESRPSIILYHNGISTKFGLPEAPGSPQAVQIADNSIDLAWTAPAHGTNFNYTIFYRSKSETNFKSLTTNGTQCTVSGLLSNSEYEFQVQAKSVFVTKSNIKCIQTEKTVRHADTFLKVSKCISPQTKPTIFHLPLIFKHKNARAGLYKYEIQIPKKGLEKILPRWPKPHKVLMVLGATGAGKSTLINGIANYLLGVRWEDDFRFKIITDEGNQSQSHSQTKNITAYSFRSTIMPFNLTIVDTPGFGDTGGIVRDRYIADQIKQFFSGKDQCSIDQLHGIGFVTQAALARLTPTQKYIFDAILSIFGRDIGDNIFLMTTFADADTPPVLQAVADASIPYKQSFKFNNSALFAANQAEQASFNAMFWEMGYSSFKDFFQHFSKAESKSLVLTREVLKERDQLQTLIPGLQEQVRIGMIQMDVMQQEERILKQHEAELNANKDFEYSIDVTKFRQIKLEPGIHTTTCSICNFTCHKDCKIPNDEDKAGCWAMTDGSCRVCPEKCIWSNHKNVPYIHEYYTTEETRTSADLKRKYDTAKSGKEKAEAMLTLNEEKLINMQVEVYLLIEQAQKSIRRLEEIALKPNPLTELEYLDLLIESEKQEAKPGYDKRVKQYMEIRKNAELYQKVASGIDSVEFTSSARPEWKAQVQKCLEIRKQTKLQKVPNWWRQFRNYLDEVTSL